MYTCEIVSNFMGGENKTQMKNIITKIIEFMAKMRLGSFHHSRLSLKIFVGFIIMQHEVIIFPEKVWLTLPSNKT